MDFYKSRVVRVMRRGMGRNKQTSGGGCVKFDLIFLGVALPFNFYFFWATPLTALAVFVTMLLLRYVSPVGE